MYYDLYTEKKTIPTALLLILAGLIFVMVMFLYQAAHTNKKLNQKVEISQFEIGNITAESVSVYWRTDNAIDGYIKYGLDEKKLDKTAYHDQDTARQMHQRNNQLISVTNLIPETNYYFVIVINGQEVKNIDNQPFNFRTAQQTKKITKYNSSYGKIINERQLPVNNAVVIIRINQSFPLLTVSKQDGSFLISTRSVFSNKSYLPVTDIDKSDVNLEVIDDVGNKLSLTTKMKQISPNAGKIVLKKGKSTLFVKNSQPSGAVLKKNSQIVKYDEVDIIYPLIDAALAGRNPFYKGVAHPNSQINGLVLPEQFKFNVTADSQGIWDYNQSQSLNAGDHQLIINVTSPDNKKVEKKRSFVVLKSGESVLGEATPSATLTPNPSLSPVITPEITVPPSTPSATLIPSPSITPVAIVSVTVTPMPTAGMGDIFAIAWGSAGLIILGIGLLMLF